MLTPDALIEAITQRPFVIFSITYLVLAVILGGLSEGRMGRRLVVIDVGLCALFGMMSSFVRSDRHLLVGRRIYRAVDQGDFHPFDKGVGQNGDRVDHIPHPSS